MSCSWISCVCFLLLTFFFSNLNYFLVPFSFRNLLLPYLSEIYLHIFIHITWLLWFWLCFHSILWRFWCWSEINLYNDNKDLNVIWVQILARIRETSYTCSKLKKKIKSYIPLRSHPRWGCFRPKYLRCPFLVIYQMWDFDYKSSLFHSNKFLTKIFFQILWRLSKIFF